MTLCTVGRQVSNNFKNENETRRQKDIAINKSKPASTGLKRHELYRIDASFVFLSDYLFYSLIFCIFFFCEIRYHVSFGHRKAATFRSLHFQQWHFDFNFISIYIPIDVHLELIDFYVQLCHHPFNFFLHIKTLQLNSGLLKSHVKRIKCHNCNQNRSYDWPRVIDSLRVIDR